MSNCYAEAFGYDNHDRHRGKDEPDTPLLRELEGAGGEGDVVIGSEQGDQGDHEAGNDPDPALEIKPAAGIEAAASGSRSCCQV